MCGIAGFLGPWPGQPAEAMVAVLRHRGPDDEGCHFDEATGLALGHTRLSIIDLTDAAHQPMSTADGRYTTSFNGEIYNYRGLRDELEEAGIALRTRSDTEVLLALYVRDQAACLDRLHGMFAFSIWDSVEKRLFLARDHLGVKLLYYAVLDQGFLFTSELKAATLCRDLPRDIDPVALADHLGLLWTAGEATILQAVRKLRPGCTLTADAAGARVQRYYRTPLPSRWSPMWGSAHCCRAPSMQAPLSLPCAAPPIRAKSRPFAPPSSICSPTPRGRPGWVRRRGLSLSRPGLGSPFSAPRSGNVWCSGRERTLNSGASAARRFGHAGGG